MAGMGLKHCEWDGCGLIGCAGWMEAYVCGCRLDVCGCGNVTPFLKFMRVGFKLRGAGAGKNFQPTQNSAQTSNGKSRYDVTVVCSRLLVCVVR